MCAYRASYAEEQNSYPTFYTKNRNGKNDHQKDLGACIGSSDNVVSRCICGEITMHSSLG